MPVSIPLHRIAFRRGSAEMGLRFERSLVRALAVCVAGCVSIASSHAVRAAASLPVAAEAANATSQNADQKRTRFIIALDRRTTYQVFSLSNPNRVVVELPAVGLRLPPVPKDGPVGLVSGFRGGGAGAGKSKVIIRVTEPVFVETAKLEMKDGKEPQLVLDIVALASAPVAPVVVAEAPEVPETPRPEAKFDKPFALGAAGLLPRPPQPAQRPDTLAKRTAKQLIVIDPGHGGHDSGAKKNGVVEKDVVLAFSKTLRKKLEDTGRYRVLMTRETDKFIALGDRTAFAEKHNASLFIAVHADYASSSASGASIYSLRPSVAERLKSNARARASDIEIPDSKFAAIDAKDSDIVKMMLADRATAAVEVTHQRTDLFSRSVVEYMGDTTNLRSNPHKTAAFKVLKSALVPSVLIELAYVTNKNDAKLLQSDSWRRKVADSITDAVDSYFSQNIAKIPM